MNECLLDGNHIGTGHQLVSVVRPVPAVLWYADLLLPASSERLIEVSAFGDAFAVLLPSMST